MLRLSRLFISLSKEQVHSIIRANRHRYARQSSNPSEFVEMIDKAIQLGRKVEIWYTSVADGVEVRRIVSPLAWQTKKNFVYCVCYNNHGDVRTYRLDRITKVKESWTDARTGPYDNYYEYFKDDIVPQYNRPDTDAG